MNNRIIEHITLRSRESILEKSKRAYINPSLPHDPTSDPVVHIKTGEDKVSDMISRMKENKFMVETCEEGSLEETINKIASSYGFKSMIYPKNLGIDTDKILADKKTCYNKDIESIRHDVFHSDFSVVRAMAGVASHGVALVVSSSEQPRMISLSPALCIMLLKKGDVVGSLADGLRLVKERFHDGLPTNILFIAGPSRTSDIELETVFGVHGPQKVHIIVY